jgi:hypothetical protein
MIMWFVFILVGIAGLTLGVSIYGVFAQLESMIYILAIAFSLYIGFAAHGIMQERKSKDNIMLLVYAITVIMIIMTEIGMAVGQFIM